MAIDIDDIFRRGGRKLVNLLDYAVRTIQVDLVFIFLVEEYRLHATTPKAVALYDIFCAPQALARLSTVEILPPVNAQIESSIRPLRMNLVQMQAAPAGSAIAPKLILPPKYIFDSIVLHLRKNSRGLRAIKRNYRPSRSPMMNLPEGRMNEAQRYFVDRVWEPILRPRLIAAGFRHMTAIA
ncbi:MAG: hypothetical protein ABMA01_02460 [Chthoniobacteraceae bacterium]